MNEKMPGARVPNIPKPTDPDLLREEEVPVAVKDSDYEPSSSGEKTNMAERLAQSASWEWWLGNGLGGWSSGTAAGVMSRKYHALLAVSHPSVEQRLILLGKMEETALLGGERIHLSTNYYPGTVHPEGWKYIERFSFDGAAARWTYRVAGRRLAKEVWCERGQNATYIRYSLLEGDPLGMEAVPLVSGRAAHGLGLPEFMRDAGSGLAGESGIAAGGIVSEKSVRYNEPLPWGIEASAGLFRSKPDLYYKMQYPLEEERGEPFEEDWAAPGRFEFMLREGQMTTLTAWASPFDPDALPASPPESEEASRRVNRLVNEFRAYNKFAETPWLERLVRASDSFIIKDGAHYNIVAGYPYFGVWARDAMISLPGLCIYTGRHGLARDIIDGWMGVMQKGLLPNRFDSRGRPVYESADGTLWMFWAIGELEREGGLDMPTMRKWWPHLSKALRAWISDNKLVRIDGDGLVVLREERLTWMDAARANTKDSKKIEAITPRAGKRVEINALWIHALNCAERWAHDMQDRPAIHLFGETAHLARSNFHKFYNEYAHYLDDGIEPTDGAMRPNQLWAIALPGIGLGPVQARRALGALSQPMWLDGAGVRTLSPNDQNYHAHMLGTMAERDEAYHQGAVWPWLCGAWVEAWLRIYPQRAQELQRQMKSIVERPLGGALLSMPEIRDPTSGKNEGCPTQAWSVAECLRAGVLLERARHWKGFSMPLANNDRIRQNPLMR